MIIDGVAFTILLATIVWLHVTALASSRGYLKFSFILFTVVLWKATSHPCFLPVVQNQRVGSIGL